MRRPTKSQARALKLAIAAVRAAKTYIADARLTEPRGKRDGHMLAAIRQLAIDERWLVRLKREGAR